MHDFWMLSCMFFSSSAEVRSSKRCSFIWLRGTEIAIWFSINDAPRLPPWQNLLHSFQPSLFLDLTFKERYLDSAYVKGNFCFDFLSCFESPKLVQASFKHWVVIHRAPEFYKDLPHKPIQLHFLSLYFPFSAINASLSLRQIFWETANRTNLNRIFPSAKTLCESLVVKLINIQN